MSTTTQTTVDVSRAISACLADIDGLRVYEYVADTTRPPSGGGAVVIAQPDIDYADTQSGFCAASWTFPLTIVVARNSALDAQRALARLVTECALALRAAEPDGVFAIEPLDAVPTTANVGGIDLPAYTLRVVVRA